MDIAAMSMSMHSAQLMQNVSLSVTKNAMETQEVAMQGLLEMLPPSNHIIDVLA